MSPSKKIFSEDGTVMLAARKAALRLHCAPDYIGKLCREGKLKGERVDNAWFVDPRSIAAFEEARQRLHAERAQKLAHERKEESRAYRYQNGGLITRARMRT